MEGAQEGRAGWARGETEFSGRSKKETIMLSVGGMEEGSFLVE